jgi:hypothetical protein
LLHDNRSHAKLLDPHQNPLDFLHDYRRKTLIRFIERQKPHIARQCPGDCKHLLLAARKRHPILLATFGEAREMLVNAIESPTMTWCDLGEVEVLFHHKAGDHPPVLRHKLELGRQNGPGACFRVRLPLVGAVAPAAKTEEPAPVEK